MRSLLLSSLILVIFISICGQSCVEAAGPAIKFKLGTATEENWAYGLSVTPPWKEGGILWVNFPEHLEYGDQGMGISRYSDKRENAWKLERGGTFAHYEVDSLRAEGVRVEAKAEIIQANKVKFSIEIINNSESLTLDNVKPLLCYQYKTLTNFPQSLTENFKYTYVVIDGEIKSLADIPTKNPETTVKGATVKPHPPYRTQFPSRRGGWIEKPLDLAVSVVTSEDDKRGLILYGQPGRSMLSNAFIPCLHADPYFGHIRPGERKVGTVTVIFVEGDWRAEVKKILEAHRKSQVKDNTAAGDGKSNECDNWQKVHPEWIFCDDFENDTAFVRQGRYFEYGDDDGKFIAIDGVGLGGSRGMRAIFEPGKGNAGCLHLGFGKMPHSRFDRGIRSGEDFREVYYRMYLKMQKGWRGNPHKLSRATVFAGADFSQAMIAHIWQGTVNYDEDGLGIDPVRCVDKNSNVKCKGYNDFANMDWLGHVSGVTPIFDSRHDGIWYCVEAHVKLNDPGKSNGVHEFWIDGNREVRRDDLNFVESYTDYGINAVYLENYIGRGMPQRQERYFDNFVVSTQPIGCLP